jgi:hemoglobin
MKNLTDIQNREDVNKLVNTFYATIKKDDFLGPIFNRMIPEENWEAHLIKLTDFWETNLFNVMKFKGNPMVAHQRTDKTHNYSIEQKHFVYWLKLWFKTIDSLFDGDKAEMAKERARRMSTHLFVDIWKHKPENK